MPKNVRYRNDGEDVCKFTIYSNPGVEPTYYEVEPGDTCEVPSGYGPQSNFMKRRAPSMTPADQPVKKPAKAKGKGSVKVSKDGTFSGLGKGK